MSMVICLTTAEVKIITILSVWEGLGLNTWQLVKKLLNIYLYNQVLTVLNFPDFQTHWSQVFGSILAGGECFQLYDNFILFYLCF